MAETVSKSKILFILEAGDVFPSGYVRGLIYRDLLIKNGYEARYISRLPIPLLRIELEIRKIFPAALAAPLERAIRLLQKVVARLKESYLIRICKDYRIIYMSKVMEYRTVVKIRKNTDAYLIYDFGDALWLKKWVDMRGILSTVDAVTTDSAYTASYVRQFNKNCTVVPDSPQIEEFDRARNEAAKGSADKLTLGWIGSPSSFYNLGLIYEPLERIFSKYRNLRLRILGAGHNVKLPRFFDNINYYVLPRYDQDTMIREVLAMDIGLFPLYDDDFSRSHGILKAAIYMSGEAAVISSPVGQCNDLITDGSNGMLAGTSEEWEQKLEALITDDDLRKRIAKKGREEIAAKYSLEQNFKILLGVVNRGREVRN